MMHCTRSTFCSPNCVKVASRMSAAIPPLNRQLTFLVRSMSMSAQAEECKESVIPKCGVQFKASPCQKKVGKPKKPATHHAVPESLPADEKEIKLKRPPICCGNKCMNALPRFDLLYYRRSDKGTRVYQQTWAECPDEVVIRKPICDPSKIKYPMLEKRLLADRPKTAAKQTLCADSKATCARTTVPGCRTARRPPKCHENRKPTDCVKRKAPYVSFSECTRESAKPIRQIECKCLNLPSMCEVWAQFHRLHGER